MRRDFENLKNPKLSPMRCCTQKRGVGQSDLAVGVESQHLVDFNKNTKDPSMQIFSQIHQKTSELQALALSNP